MAKSPRIKATVGPFVFAYPHLTSPDTEGQYADNKYKVDGIGDPNSDAMKRARKITADAAKELGAPKGGTVPLKKEKAKNDKGVKEETGNLLFRCKSQYAPEIVDASGKPIPEGKLKKLKIGAGSEGLLQGYFSVYSGANAGMSFTLTGVQLIKVVSGGGGAEFSAYDGGGFTIDGDEDEDAADDGLDLDANDDEDEGDGGDLDI